MSMAVKPEHSDRMATEAKRIIDRYFPPPIRLAIRPFVRIPSFEAILAGVDDDLQDYTVREWIAECRKLVALGKLPRQL